MCYNQRQDDQLAGKKAMDFIDTSADPQTEAVDNGDESPLLGMPDCWDGLVMSAEAIRDVLSEVLRTGKITDKQKFIVQDEMQYMTAFVGDDVFDKYWTRLPKDRFEEYWEMQRKALWEKEIV
jgi:hypothetical protein